MTIWQFKILAVVLLISTGLAGGLIPLRISLSDRGRRFLALGNAFSGGIFLGAGVIHMLGDSIETFGSMANAGGFPWALLICCCGFLGILLLEKVLVRRDESDVAVSGRSVYPYILLLVLSVHSVIAGMTFGLEASMAASFVIFIALIAHKGAAGFALGIGLRSSGARASTHRGLVALFACMTPLGIGLGSILSALIAPNGIAGVEAIFDALAAGTFLYVAIVDIIAETFVKRTDALAKFSLIAAGFGLMAILALWT